MEICLTLLLSLLSIFEKPRYGTLPLGDVDELLSAAPMMASVCVIHALELSKGVKTEQCSHAKHCHVAFDKEVVRLVWRLTFHGSVSFISFSFIQLLEASFDQHYRISKLPFISPEFRIQIAVYFTTVPHPRCCSFH